MIYFLQENELFRNRVKIGYSTRPLRRFDDLNTASSTNLKLLLVLGGDQEMEKVYHDRFAKYRHKGEWFKYGLLLRIFVWVNRLKSVEYKLAEIETKDKHIDDLEIELSKVPGYKEKIDRLQQRVVKLREERDAYKGRLDDGTTPIVRTLDVDDADHIRWFMQNGRPGVAKFKKGCNIGQVKARLLRDICDIVIEESHTLPDQNHIPYGVNNGDQPGNI